MVAWRGERGPIETSPENVGWSNTSDTHLPFCAFSMPKPMRITEERSGYEYEVSRTWGEGCRCRAVQLSFCDRQTDRQTDWRRHRAALLLPNVWVRSDCLSLAPCADRNTEWSSLAGCYAVYVGIYLPTFRMIVTPPSSGLCSPRRAFWTL